MLNTISSKNHDIEELRESLTVNAPNVRFRTIVDIRDSNEIVDDLDQV